MYCVITEEQSNQVYILFTYYDEIKKRAHYSKIVGAEENLMLSHGGVQNLCEKAKSIGQPLRPCLRR